MELVVLVAVMVKAVADNGAVGVPEIKPVVESNVRPAGSAGVIAKLLIVPPVDRIV